ncbi:MAG TPA: LysM domain-containing protein [Dehalococcoidia bacterium]|nr:LysM domain-containing protein [Dehalococcoidia bacterium]
MVSSGENLTVIARRYEVPLPEVIAANEFENPDLIYPQQQIVIPSPIAGGGE